MNIDQNIIIAIDQNINSDSKYYGKLVKWKCNSNNNKWSYGIGLSDQNILIFDTSQKPKIIEANFFIFIVIFHRQKFSQDEIIERLKYTMMYIAEKQMLFDEEKWNDEHFARLISTNNAISYRVSAKFKKNNKYKQNINDYLKKNNPDHYINTSRFFVQKFWHRGRFWVLIFLIILYCLLVSFSIPQYLILIILISALTIIHRLSEYKWSGFQDKQLWNWLELLIIPILLAFGGFFLQTQTAQRQKYFDAQQKKQQSLKEYFKSVQGIVNYPLKKNRSKEIEKEYQETKSHHLIDNLSYEEIKIIESFTQLVFSEIDGKQKRQVVKFLYALGLIKCHEDKNENSCEKIINLERADLTKADLKNLDLKNVLLEGVNLKDADLSNADLELANLQNANLENTDFKLAKLKNATMSNADFGKNKSNIESGNKWKKVTEVTSLYSPYFLPEEKNINQRSCLQSNKNNISNTNNSNFKNFKNQDFSQANLERLDLIEANFKEANLSGASLRGTNLQNANLTKSVLRNTKLEGAYLKGIKIDKNSRKKLDPKYQLIIRLFENRNNQINLAEKDLSNSDLTNINLQGMNLTKKIRAQNTNLSNTKLTCAKLSNIDLSNSYLFEVDLRYANLSNVVLKNTNLSSSKLNQTTFQNVDFTNSFLFTADLSGSEIINSDFKEANLNSTNLSGANLSNTKNLDKAELSGAIYDKNTKFPKSFNPQKAGMYNKDELR